MSRSVLARFTPFAAICLGAASPVRAASEPGILDLTGVAHVQDELALGGRGVTLAVVGTAADTVALAAVVSEVAPDADVLSLAAGESIDSEVDVVVFADPADATSAVVDALAGRGVSVIVPMGDAGRGAALSTSALARALRVAATAGPDVATATLDVKAPEVLGGRFGVRPVAGLGLPLASGARIAGDVRAWDACGGASAPTSSGDVLLVPDARCDLGPLAAAALTSGAAALLVASPPGEVELWQPAGASLAALPLFAVDGRLAARLAASIAAGTTVSVELRDGLAADQRLVDTVLFASTRGPTFTPGAAGGSAADPTLTMGPELAAPGQGTALAAAYVAGVVALVREAHPDWSADVIAAQLVATTAPAWSASEPLVGGSPSAGGAGGTRASLSLGGSGRIDAYQALVGHVRMRPAAPGPASPALDLGLVRASAVTTLTRTLTVSNDGETAVTVALAAAFRDASDAQGGVLVTVDPPSLELGAGEEKPVTVSFRIDPAALRAPTVIPTAGPVASAEPANAWAADEVDGWVRATVGDVRLAVPFFLVPRATATTAATADTCLASSAFALTLDPAGGPGGRAELFTLLADGDPTVGVRVATLPTPALEVAVALSAVPVPGRSAIAVLVDGDGDHTVDRVLLAAPEHLVSGATTPGLATGRLVSAVLTPAAEGALTLPWGRFDVVETRAVVGDPLGPTRVVSGSLSALGLAADAAPTLAVFSLDLTTSPASATTVAAAPAGTTPGASLTTGLAADPRCGYSLVSMGVDVRGATPLALASGPTCDSATNASGLLALDLQADAAHAALRILPPADAVYTCDATIGATADPETCAASPDFRAHVHGACVGAVTAGPAEARTYPLGQTPVEVVIQDPWGHRTTCQTTVDVADRAAPEVTCGAIDLDSNTLPLAHTSTAHDTCGGPVTVTIVGARCLVQQNGEITFDRPSECQVGLDGTSTMQVVDVGPVANLFEWSVSASDEAGNEAQETCYAVVTRDEVGAIGGGGCAAGGGLDGVAAGLLTALLLVTRSRGRRSSHRA